MAQHGHHEFTSASEPVETSGDRSFGFVFAAVFALLAGLNGWRSGQAWPFYAILAAAFLAAALLRPAVLAPLNRVWTALGLLLGKIVSPIVLGALYFLLFAPIGLFLRLRGRDLLRLRRDPDAASYWIVREPPGPAPDSMREQF